MKQYSDISQIIANIISIMLDPIIKMIPRNKKKWVYGAYGGFKDNPKYLFYQTIEKHPEIRPIWIARSNDIVRYIRNQGFEAYYWLSLKGLYHTATSKVFISDHQIGDINRFLTGGCYFANLWHGSSVKKVRWQAPELMVEKYHLKNADEMRTSLRFRLRTYHYMFRKPDFCLAPSKIQARDFFSEMLDIPLKNCCLGIFPRSIFLIKGEEEALSFIKKYEPIETLDFINKIRTFKKTYIYMPTWRNDERDFITQAEINWEQLNQVLCDKNNLLILRLHPFTKYDLSAVSKYENIIVYPSVSDIYTVLPFIDCLITDYSSIYTDFVMMNKGVILFVFDLADYTRGGFPLADFDTYYPGLRVYNFSQLLNVIESDEDCLIPQKSRDFVMNYFWDNNRNDIDIVEEIKTRIKNK